MKLLLDTHAWCSRPSAFLRARKRLTAADTQLWLSLVSIWEVLLLAERRRVELRPSAERWIETFFERVPVREAALTRDVRSGASAFASRTMIRPSASWQRRPPAMTWCC